MKSSPHPGTIRHSQHRQVWWLLVALLPFGGTGCESLIDSAEDNCNRRSYEHYYEHAGYDHATAESKASFDVLWDRTSAQMNDD